MLSSRGSQSSDRGSRKDKRAGSRESSSRGRRRRSRSRSSSRSRSRGRERRRRSSSSSLSSRARSRRERSWSSERYRSRRDSSRSRRDVTDLDPRIDIGHAVTAFGVTGRGLLTAIGHAVSVRVPLPAGESGVNARVHPPSRIARVTARGLASDYLALLPACGRRRQDGWPDEKPRRVLGRLPRSLLWFLKRRRPPLLLQEGRL